MRKRPVASERHSARRDRRGVGEEPSRRPGLRAVEASLWLLVLVLFVIRLAPQLRAAASAHRPTRPSAIGFAMLDGSTQPLRALKGRVVLVNFWATWCPPCRAEMPGFQQVFETRRGAGFTVVGVSMDDRSREEVAAFLRERGITYPIAVATPDLDGMFGTIDSYPTSFLLDRRGNIRYTVHGVFAAPQLRAAIDRLLAERS